jgi:hypothetical protein
MSKNQFLPLNFGLNIAVLSLCLGFTISFLFDKPTGSTGLKMVSTDWFFQNKRQVPFLSTFSARNLLENWASLH